MGTRAAEDSQVANNTTDSVLREDIDGVVNADPKLDRCCQIAPAGTDDAKNHGGPGGDESSCFQELGTDHQAVFTNYGGLKALTSWCDSNQSGNGTTAETNSAPFPLQAVVQKTPGETTDAGSDMGDHASHYGAQVTSEGAATVEAEPADPEEDCSQYDVGDIVRAVGEAVDLGVTCALAQHQGVGEGGGAR